MSEPITVKLKEFDIFSFLVDFKDSIIEGINGIVFLIAPDHPSYFVFFVSVIIAVLITRWKKENFYFGAVATFLIFSTLRFMGVGG